MSSPRSLLRTNPWLSAPGADLRHARNVASSTAIETGRPIEHYIHRILKQKNRPGIDLLDIRCRGDLDTGNHQLDFQEKKP